MAFDFFSQPRGPNIDIRLFPAAASAGIDAGNAQATIPGAIVQGLSQGAKLAGQLNEVMQLPVENAQAQENLERTQLQNEILQLESQFQKDNEDLILRAKKAELEQKVATTNTAATDLKNQDLIFEALKDPLNAKNVIYNPEFTGTFARNSKLMEAVAGQLAARGMLSEEEKTRLQERIDFTESRKYKQELDKVEAQNRNKLLQQADAIRQKTREGSIPYLMNKYGLNEFDLASRVQTFPAGVKEFNADGTVKPGDNDLTKAYADPGLSGQFDVVIDGKKANIRLKGTENEAVQNLQQLYTAQGLIAPSQREQPSAPPVAAETSSTKPFSSQFSKAVEENQGIVSQRGQELIERAKNDPALLNRLVAKGMLKQELAGDVATPASQGAPIPGVTSPNTKAPTTPSASVSKNIYASDEQMKQNVSDVRTALSPAAKRYVNSEVMTKVLSQPLLRNLDPLYQAVAAVESKGVATAKNKGSSATGYFQLTDDAALDVKVDKNIPSQNVEGGTAYLDRLLAQFGGNEIAALMAYNIGMGPVGDAIALTSASDYDSILFGIKYLHQRGKYPKSLTPKNIEIVAKYPAQVLAYKEAFQALSYV